MAQTTNENSDLDSKCAKARPWVRHFLEEYQDGRPWGYAIFLDPTIDDELMDECMCRIDNMLWCAQDAVFGRNHAEFPPFIWEVLDWPEGGENGDAGDCDNGDAAAESASKREIDDESAADNLQGVAHGSVKQSGSEDGSGTEEPEDGETDSDQQELSEEDNEDDADIETVRELNKLRSHFECVRDRAKKRRKAHEPEEVDRSGIPNGLLRNVFLVIDQDVIDGIVVNSPMADSAWIWAIDPDYGGNIASMTKNGLRDEYYGYMRVRVQQLVNNFWNARHCHEDELPLPMLWAAARQSRKNAFVSLDPAEAQMVSTSMLMGSAMRAPAG